MKMKNAKRILLFCITALLMPMNLTITALAAPDTVADPEPETGWIEAKASVPEGFNGVVIVSMENQETLEEFDVDCLWENEYVGSKAIPAGDYRVTMAFVYQNYTYSVRVEPASFTVKSDGTAVPITLTVIAPEAKPEPTAEPEIEQGELSTEVSEGTVEEQEPVSAPESREPIVFDNESETVAEQEQESGHSFHDILMDLVFGLLGTLVFISVVFCACWLYRRYKENNS